MRTEEKSLPKGDSMSARDAGFERLPGRRQHFVNDRRRFRRAAAGRAPLQLLLLAVVTLAGERARRATTAAALALEHAARRLLNLRAYRGG
jgi:hypothetical protein